MAWTVNIVHDFVLKVFDPYVYENPVVLIQVIEVQLDFDTGLRKAITQKETPMDLTYSMLQKMVNLTGAALSNHICHTLLGKTKVLNTVMPLNPEGSFAYCYQRVSFILDSFSEVFKCQ